jgi:hypothetical protein
VERRNVDPDNRSAITQSPKRKGKGAVAQAGRRLFWAPGEIEDCAVVVSTEKVLERLFENVWQGYLISTAWKEREF